MLKFCLGVFLFASQCTAETKYAIAKITSAVQDGTISGTVRWTQIDHGDVTVVVDVSGLTDGEHGFHVHQFGDLSGTKVSSVEYHFIPKMICEPCGGPIELNSTQTTESVSQCEKDHKVCVSDAIHGYPPSNNRQPGDMGNVTSEKGNCVHTSILGQNKMSLSDGVRSIIGRSVVFHSKADDGSQPWGAAGDPMAWGIIGIAKPEEGISNEAEAPDLPPISSVVCIFEGGVSGRVLITKPEMDRRTILDAEIDGLTKGEKSFHFHQWGDLRGDYDYLGPVYKPENEHLLDQLSTMKVSSNDKTTSFKDEFEVSSLLLHAGRSLTIHDGPDTSYPTIAATVCGIANPTYLADSNSNDDSNNSNGSKSSLSGGGVAAIVIVVLLVVGGSIGAVYYMSLQQDNLSSKSYPLVVNGAAVDAVAIEGGDYSPPSAIPSAPTRFSAKLDAATIARLSVAIDQSEDPDTEEL